MLDAALVCTLLIALADASLTWSARIAAKECCSREAWTFRMPCSGLSLPLMLETVLEVRSKTVAQRTERLT